VMRQQISLLTGGFGLDAELFDPKLILLLAVFFWLLAGGIGKRPAIWLCVLVLVLLYGPTCFRLCVYAFLRSGLL